ncbi:hypothetical protein [Aquipseudomonas alcaligenes]|uniref:Uncharacterized protein n=1 Tax=Aquipseudomonas alcaligenes TaxID=43263 RepID=A0A1N6U264_AQUAC|nr:hypothetical protein [Pseudomonas alcaligenes]SIQ59722.1 hypothetical protein SAMN05878282_105328 [Pseudomonas alcaligenes]
MSDNAAGLDILSAVGFLGQSVLLELVWDDDPDPCWRSGYVIGVVLLIEGVHEQAFLVVKNPGDDYPLDVYLSDIRSIQATRGQSGNVLGHLPLPQAFQGLVAIKEGERRHA